MSRVVWPMKPGTRRYKMEAEPKDAVQEVQVDDEQARIEFERKRLAEIRLQAAKAQERHDAYLQAKDAASAAKAQWESAVETLQDLCLEHDEPLPLLDGQPGDGSWREVRLESLDNPPIKPGTLAHLKGAEIETVGQLADYSREHDIKDVDGIGEAAETNIHEALDAFWKTRPQNEADDPAEAAAENKGNGNGPTSE